MEKPDSEQAIKQRATRLILLGAISAVGYAVLLWLSWQFADKVPSEQRPTLWMLALFGAEFVCYWGALWLAVRLPPTKWLLGGIFAAACLFRGVLLPSIPMHEIDFHRYIWDGAVLAEGVSPYRYAPLQVREAVNSPTQSSDETLNRLVALQGRSKSLSNSLFAIHYEKHPSPYPLVSQAVFALAAVMTPDTSSPQTRLVIMKALLVLIDLATLLVVMLLLREVGRHPGWSLAYGWCPLMMKEVANGGHLDSIAIFLTTLAIWLLVRSARTISPPKLSSMALAGFVLALAIGAKIYPIVLTPLFAAVWLRRLGWRPAVVGIACAAVLTAGLLSPFFGSSAPAGLSAEAESPTESPVEAADGIRTFLKQWEMNDLIFMVVLENLREQAEVTTQQKPWFVVTTDAWARSTVTRWLTFSQWLAGNVSEINEAEPTSSELKAASFSLARLLTGGVFALVACCLAWRGAGKEDPQAWCRAAMLTLAWFWFTCPTQNPWYWCWVLPLLPFARYRTWYVVAAMTMLYYLRFWLTAHYPDPPVLGTPYNGAYFFYFIIAWVEFVPCLLGLAVEWLRKRGKTLNYER